jgi:hypothetical protein
MKKGFLNSGSPSKTLKKGFLGGGSSPLYPDGSREALPTGWRSKQALSERQKVFELASTADGYEVRGAFREAGRFLGKEDFDVAREGFKMRIRGHPNADKQSFVAGLDETVALPGDADWTRISAEYRECCLTIRIGRSEQLAEWLAQLTLDEARALAAKHGVIAPALAAEQAAANGMEQSGKGAAAANVVDEGSTSAAGGDGGDGGGGGDGGDGGDDGGGGDGGDGGDGDGSGGDGDGGGDDGGGDGEGDVGNDGGDGGGDDGSGDGERPRAVVMLALMMRVVAEVALAELAVAVMAEV